MKTVRAIEIGYDNVTVRDVGDVFEVPDDWKAPWFVDKDSPVQPVKKQEGKPVVATTLSGIQAESANELV